MDTSIIEGFEKLKTEQQNQARLNLAINYMVIEHIIKCMGLDNQLYAEHEMLPVIFNMAKQGTLLDLFQDLAQQELDRVKIVFELLYNITGLDPKILSGVDQISLGIQVDPNNNLAVEFSKMETSDLNDYVENQLGNPIYDDLPWFDSMDEENQTNQSIKEQIGQVKTTASINYEAATQRWASNPLGLNTLGLFAYLVEAGKIPAPANWNPDWEADVFDKSFYTFRMDAIRSDGSSPDAQWKENIYSLNTITKFILRCLQDNKIWKRIYGDTDNSLEKEYKVLDHINVKLPYPLVIDTSKSDLLELIYNLTLFGRAKKADRGYGFAPQYMEQITWSSIKDEIKHWEEYIDKADKITKIIQQSEKILINELYLAFGNVESTDADRLTDEELSEYGSTREEFESTIQKSVEETKETSTREENLSSIEKILPQTEKVYMIETQYIPYLNASQQMFDSDKAGWVKQMHNLLDKKSDKLKAERKQLMQKLGLKTEDDDLATIWDGANKEDLFDFIRKGEAIEYLKAMKETVKAKAKSNIPWIPVLEPYYRDTEIRFRTKSN